MLTTKQKEKVIEEFATHKKDTGSPEVQIALLTKEIKLPKIIIQGGVFWVWFLIEEGFFLI